MGCSRCRTDAFAPGGVDGIARHLPQDAEVAVVVPDLGVLGQRLEILERLKIASFAAQLQGLPTAKAWMDVFLTQLGINLRSPEAMKKAGLAPERGLAVVGLSGIDRFVVLGVKDKGAWTDTLATLVKTRLDAGVRREVDVGGKRLTTFSPSDGAPPLVSMVVEGDYALVALAPPEKLARYASLPAKESLAELGELQKKLGRLKGERDLWAYVPPASALGRQMSLSDSLFTLSISPEAILLRGDLTRAAGAPELALFQPQPDAAKLLGRLPAASFGALRFSGDPSKLAPHLPRLLGPGVMRRLKEAGFDVPSEILSNLKPGMVAALELSPAPPLAAGVPQLDFRRTNPFRYVHLSGFAQVQDPAKAKATFAKLPAVASSFAARLTPEQREGHDVLVTSYSQGEGVHLALKGDLVTFASPEAKLNALLAGAQNGEGLPPQMQKALEGHAFSWVVDLHRIAQSIQALPTEAWGIGGFAIKATVVRWLEATDDLRAVSVGVSSQEQALQFETRLRLHTP